MQFTKAEEYGMLGVLYLASKGMKSITPLSEISETQAIPEKFLAKIFQSLSRYGIIRSHRGVRGGFSMAKKPDEVTVKDVLESIQGPYHLTKCIKETDICDKTAFCSIRELLIIAENNMVSVFQKHTLADLIKWQKNSSITA